MTNKPLATALATLLMAPLTLLGVVSPSQATSPTVDAVAGQAASTWAPPSDVLDLASRPGSKITLYLNFAGGTFSKTLWNQSYGRNRIAIKPFSINAPADLDFDEAERRVVYDTWMAVAEDYAPFDINVTTADPGEAAIIRSSRGDRRYGVSVLFTQNGPYASLCHCLGVSHTGSVRWIGKESRSAQPGALVMTYPATQNSSIGDMLGNTASHEAGHAFGLSHDGTSASEYYGGLGSAWAPIMGASSEVPFSQWSNGNYQDANNHEDDIAIIAATAPLVADDYGDSSSAAEPLDPGSTVDGLISTRNDRDSFAFTASGPTSVTVSPSTRFPDLRVSLTIFDSAGRQVARKEMPNFGGNSYSEDFAPADTTWSVALPGTAQRYYAVVDGIGGMYDFVDDYGSLGRYAITLQTAG